MFKLIVISSTCFHFLRKQGHALRFNVIGDDRLYVIFIFTRIMRCLLTKFSFNPYPANVVSPKMLSAYYLCSGSSLIRVHMVCF